MGTLLLFSSLFVHSSCSASSSTFTSASTCGCDLEYGKCEAFCCCDPDCPSATISQFKFCIPWEKNPSYLISCDPNGSIAKSRYVTTSTIQGTPCYSVSKEYSSSDILSDVDLTSFNITTPTSLESSPPIKTAYSTSSDSYSDGDPIIFNTNGTANIAFIPYGFGSSICNAMVAVRANVPISQHVCQSPASLLTPLSSGYLFNNLMPALCNTSTIGYKTPAKEDTFSLNTGSTSCYLNSGILAYIYFQIGTTGIISSGEFTSTSLTTSADRATSISIIWIYDSPPSSVAEAETINPGACSYTTGLPLLMSNKTQFLDFEFGVDKLEIGQYPSNETSIIFRSTYGDVIVDPSSEGTTISLNATNTTASTYRSIFTFKYRQFGKSSEPTNVILSAELYQVDNSVNTIECRWVLLTESNDAEEGVANQSFYYSDYGTIFDFLFQEPDEVQFLLFFFVVITVSVCLWIFYDFRLE